MRRPRRRRRDPVMVGDITMPVGADCLGCHLTSDGAIGTRPDPGPRPPARGLDGLHRLPLAGATRPDRRRGTTASTPSSACPATRRPPPAAPDRPHPRPRARAACPVTGARRRCRPRWPAARRPPAGCATNRHRSRSRTSSIRSPPISRARPATSRGRPGRCRRATRGGRTRSASRATPRRRRERPRRRTTWPGARGCAPSATARRRPPSSATGASSAATAVPLAGDHRRDQGPDVAGPRERLHGSDGPTRRLPVRPNVGSSARRSPRRSIVVRQAGVTG